MVKVGDIFDTTRALMNDTTGAVYTDAVLIPYFKIAYDELRLELEDYQIPIGILTSDEIRVNAGVTTIGGDGGPSLPKHLIEIMSIYERTYGTTNDFVVMTRQITLPKTEVRTQYLEVWSWQNQRVKLLGATNDIGVKIDYIGEIPDIVNQDNVVELTNSKVALAARTAALCAQFIEENAERYQAAMDTCNNAIDKMLNIKIKPQQRIPIRRQPFMARYKARTGTGYGR